MMGGDLERYLPPEWAESYEPLALLKDGERRQTLLLRERGTGRRAVMKRALEEAEHLQSEYDLLTALAGPGVPVVYAHLRSGGASYLLREYLDGETLLDHMQKHPRLSAREVARIGVEICRVLRRLHEQEPPVVHRDVKAENVILLRDGSCALIDFGIARRQRGSAQRDTELLGTPSVAPPEQFGFRQTAPSADVYALGVLLHELSTGEIGLDRGRPPAALRRVIRRCTAMDPARRYRDAAELERALRPLTRRRALPLIACAAAVALLACAPLLRAWQAPPGEAELYAFASPAIEREVCRQLHLEPGSVTRGDLADIQHLLLVGQTPFDEWNSLAAFGEEIRVDGRIIHSAGTVDTLADIPNFPNLCDLALCRQEISDLAPLAGCAIQRLALCGNEVADLSPLAQCPQLQELMLSDNPAQDFSPLAACEYLWKVNLGATPVEDLSALVDFPSLIYVDAHDCWALTDISALADMRQLWHLSLRPATPEFLEVVSGLTQLENLYLWWPDTLPDLRALSALTHLRRLFIDAQSLSSLRGIEALTRLDYLELYSAAPLDLRPLTALRELTELWIPHIQASDWTPLASLSRLERVYCTPAQAAEIRRQLGPDAPQSALITAG